MLNKDDMVEAMRSVRDEIIALMEAHEKVCHEAAVCMPSRRGRRN